MTVNRPTRFYFFILLLNISAGSFLLLLVLDAVHSMTPAHTTRGDSLALTIVSLLWPPLSVMISLLVLRYWVNAVLKPSFPLGFDSNFESVDVDVLLGRKMVLLAFLHMLLMLSRLLARMYHLYASSQTFYLLTLAADISGECRPLSSLPSDLASCIPVYWAPIGIQWTLISIIMFSQCLIACNINTIHWGTFVSFTNSSFSFWRPPLLSLVHLWNFLMHFKGRFDISRWPGRLNRVQPRGRELTNILLWNDGWCYGLMVCWNLRAHEHCVLTLLQIFSLQIYLALWKN